MDRDVDRVVDGVVDRIVRQAFFGARCLLFCSGFFFFENLKLLVFSGELRKTLRIVYIRGGVKIKK